MSNAENKIQLLREMIADPRTPEEEKAIHRNSLLRLEQAVEIENRRPAMMVAPSNMASFHVPTATMQSASLAQEIVGKPIARVSVQRIEAQGTVLIDWSDKAPENLLQRDCRGLFTSRLKDCAASKKYTMGDLEGIKKSKSFYRAVGYYRGLCEFFRRMPTMGDLEMKHATQAQKQVFLLVQQEVQ